MIEDVLEGKRALWGFMPIAGLMGILIRMIWNMEMPVRHLMGTWLMFITTGMGMGMSIIRALVVRTVQGMPLFHRFWNLELSHTLSSLGYP